MALASIHKLGRMHKEGIGVAEFQHQMEAVFGERDRANGLTAAIAHLAEEVGELAQAVRKGTPDQQLHELGDVFAWTASLAQQLGMSLEDAARRYFAGCPRCAATPCCCPVVVAP